MIRPSSPPAVRLPQLSRSVVDSAASCISSGRGARAREDHAMYVRPGCDETYEWAHEDARAIWEVPASAIVHKEKAFASGAAEVGSTASCSL